MNWKKYLQELQNLKIREEIIFAPIYFFISLINLDLRVWLAPTWFDGTLRQNHLLLINFQYYNNEQSRLLQFMIPEVIARLTGLQIEQAYMIPRLVFIFLALILSHIYLKKWFSTAEVFAGVLLFASCLPFSYMNDLQESTPLLLVFFISGLWAIREGKTIAFLLILFVGAFANETILILSAAYFFYNLEQLNIKKVFKPALNTVLVSLPELIAFGTIRFINQGQPHLSGLFHYIDNFLWIYRNLFESQGSELYQVSYLFPFILFSMMWIYSFLAYPRCPKFMQRIYWIIPFFLAAHFLAGIWKEARLFLPLGFLLIPMSLFLVFRVPSTEKSLT